MGQNVLAARGIADCLVSHDISTPLHAILGGLELLVEGSLGSLNADSKELVAEMIRSTARLQTMLERVALIARIEQGLAGGEIADHPFTSLINHLPVTLDGAVDQIVITGDKSMLAVGFEFLVRDILAASIDAPAAIQASANEIVLTGPSALSPGSGDHQVTALLVDKICSCHKLQFGWPRAGCVKLRGDFLL